MDWKFPSFCVLGITFFFPLFLFKNKFCYFKKKNSGTTFFYFFICGCYSGVWSEGKLRVGFKQQSLTMFFIIGHSVQ